MNLTNHPRLLARMAGLFYLAIIVSALWGYLQVRGQLIIPHDMALTAANIIAHQQLYRMGFSAIVITVLCNPPMGVLLYELLKPVNSLVALLALVFIIISTTIEAVNIFNYMSPLFTLTLPEYRTAFQPAELQGIVRGANRLWSYGFSVSLAFFSVFCVLTGYLIIRSRFFPTVLGWLIIAAGAYHLSDSFITFLGLPDIPYIGLLRLPLVAEGAFALWLTVIGVDDRKWREQAEALRASRAVGWSARTGSTPP
ncbi:MAG TPA: DUF4386 domain-containing protein [Caulobacteraceae bacterium]|nr:DUF4386 domain-containing protein [Caulobacteraceae bacterium]